MTIATDIQRTAYTGNGSTTGFATTFPFFDAADIKVYLVTTSSGAEVLKTLTTHYTVSGGAGTTGTVTMLTAPASTETLVLVLDPVRTQTTDLVNGDGFDVDPIEARIDRLTLMIQRLDDRLDRAVRLKDGDPITGLSAVTTATLRRGKTLMFEDTTAADLTVGTPVSTSVVAASETASGIAELATQTETNTGTDDARIVTPLKLATRLGTVVVGAYGVRGLIGVNNSGAPTTTYDLDADTVVVRNSAANPVVLVNPTLVSVNVGTAGPAANGRDQSGAFTASTFVHFYFIYNPTSGTLAGIASAAGPATGPTLPSGYTHWCYATTIRFNGSSQLVVTYTRGDRAFYAAPVSVLSTNSPSTSQADLTTPFLVAVPSVAGCAFGMAAIAATAGGGGAINHALKLRIITAVDYESYYVLAITSNSNAQNCGFEIPNLQALFYLVTNNTNVASEQVDVTVRGYSLPNGS